MNEQRVKLIETVQVRSHWSETEEKWYFSVVDVVQVLTGSTIPKRYWSDLRKKLEKESGQPYEKIVRLIQAVEHKTQENRYGSHSWTILTLMPSCDGRLVHPVLCDTFPVRSRSLYVKHQAATRPVAYRDA